MDTKRKDVRLIGLCFILVMLCYGFGTTLLDGKNPTGMTAGVVLVIMNSVLVCYLGWSLPRALQHAGKLQARFYFVSRVSEAVLLAVALYFKVAETDNETSLLVQFWCYQTAMFSLGIGSILFGLSLKELPGLSTGMLNWGIFGYALLAVGCIAEVLGFPIGIYLSLPGGLFELTLGTVLMFTGSFGKRAFSDPAQ